LKHILQLHHHQQLTVTAHSSATNITHIVIFEFRLFDNQERERERWVKHTWLAEAEQETAKELELRLERKGRKQ
jgi:hypothetical protein